MFNKKLKNRIAELEAQIEGSHQLHTDLFSANKDLKEKVRKLEKSLEIEHEDCMNWKKAAENLGSELNKAVSFIKEKGYSVGTAKGEEEIHYSFSGESHTASGRKNEIKTLNSKLIAIEHFENDLKNKIAELQAENANLKDELARRPFAPAKKKNSKK